MEKQQELKPVSIRYDGNGNPDAVTIRTLDEEFSIKLKDEEDGKEINWHEAMKKYKMPTKRQWLLLLYYYEDVNRCLKEAGGEEMHGYFWSSSEFSSSTAWIVYFSSSGYSNYSSKSYSSRVRAVAA